MVVLEREISHLNWLNVYVLKSKELLVISYIINSALSVYNLRDKLKNIVDVTTGYNNKKIDGIFLHMSPLEIEQIAKDYNTKMVAHIAMDGIGPLILNKINEASKEDFEKWIHFHLQNCKDKSVLGYSLHGLVFLQKS